MSTHFEDLYVETCKKYKINPNDRLAFKLYDEIYASIERGKCLSGLSMDMPRILIPAGLAWASGRYENGYYDYVTQDMQVIIESFSEEGNNRASIINSIYNFTQKDLNTTHRIFRTLQTCYNYSWIEYAKSYIADAELLYSKKT